MASSYESEDALGLPIVLWVIHRLADPSVSNGMPNVEDGLFLSCENDVCSSAGLRVSLQSF
jgi:hypothetical protein